MYLRYLFSWTIPNCVFFDLKWLVFVLECELQNINSAFYLSLTRRFWAHTLSYTALQWAPWVLKWIVPHIRLSLSEEGEAVFSQSHKRDLKIVLEITHHVASLLDFPFCSLRLGYKSPLRLQRWLLASYRRTKSCFSAHHIFSLCYILT